MTNHIHLVKLCVGVDSVEQLAAYIEAAPGETRGHTTRMWPKQEEKLLNGGSLYWVIKGVIQARQEIAGLEEVIGADGVRRCRILLRKPLIRTANALRRPFQGWRYLKPEDAPADLPKGRENEPDLPGELAQALAEIGVI
ncbi:DUF1489 family protein [Celeribacter indicus]|uniref:Lysophospholipase L1 and related esterase-like protein n=1 Tax=Celeribacter indicus TaxID=1208324 RepID=A0A0B5DZN8_9RHOB|nr:DUF1489 domain-containing protein [Celeribacter indicus]AJE48514.1 hypothetical protein P73_3799 [Celeribacter indicus]SDX07520.1 hypothetical protein SAMN05443573_1134 [Celeribacter indicus]